MSSTRRIGAEDSESRAALLDAAERLILTDGYAAVTSRKVAAEAGLKPQLVHYYFRTMDDLFIELFRRRAEEGLRRVEQALAVDGTLTAIWDLTSNPAGALFNIEFAALANHRKALQAEIAEFGERYRRLQHDAVAARFAALGVPEEVCPPTVVLLALTGMAQIMSIEANFGFTTGHDEAVTFTRQLLERVEAGEWGVG